MASFIGTDNGDIIKPGFVSEGVRTIPEGAMPGKARDFICGEGGNDTLWGGGGNDALQGDEGRDRLRGNGGDDGLYGEKRADRINGGAGDDGISGDDGNDRLHGGLGSDSLFGGAKDDRFIYRRAAESGAGEGRDRIFDFQSGDEIDLRRVDADATTAGDQAFTWIGDAAFGGQAGELRYDGNLLQGDVDGDGTADFEILFDDGSHAPVAVAESDILL